MAHPSPHFRILGAAGNEYSEVEKIGADGESLGTYCILKHGDNYKVEIENPFLFKCEAKLEIDGKVT